MAEPGRKRDDFERTGRTGRVAARFVAAIGWAAILVGSVGAAAAMLRAPAADAAGAGTLFDLVPRLAAALPGLGVALLGLVAVMMAAQARAALDTADLTRALLVATRRGQSPRVAPPAERPAPPPAETAVDDVPPAPPRPRLAAPPDRARSGTAPSHPIFSARPPK